MTTNFKFWIVLTVVQVLTTLTHADSGSRFRQLFGNQSSAVDLKAFPGESCMRSCDDTQPRVCHFNWVLEHYHAMGPACRDCGLGNRTNCYQHACVTADGVERGVMTINRQIPGPTVHVCKDDLIVIDLTNAMGGTATSIHWHGLHQRETPYMDGVPFITQCPIDYMSTFRYTMWATEPGTQFYHSHSGHHKVNGHYGAMIIRQPEANDPNSHLYNYDLPEHHIVASDWMHLDGEMFFPGLPNGGGLLPVNLLINGKGRYRDPKTGTQTQTPLEVFQVSRFGRYRFRLINSASHACPLELQIANHTLEIIASDSFNLKPITVNTLLVTAGERYDFVLDADQPSGEYWIRLRATGPCEIREIAQFAVLSYQRRPVPVEKLAFPIAETPRYHESLFRGTTYANHPNTTCGRGWPDVCITDFEAYETDNSVVNGKPDHEFFLGFENYLLPFEVAFGLNKHEHFMNIHSNIVLQGAINFLSFAHPPFSLLTQPKLIDESMFCDRSNRPERCANRSLCTCTHRLKIELNSLVELNILDLTPQINDLNHPFHLHGTAMYVMEMYQNRSQPITIAEAETRARARSLLPPAVARVQQNPPIKDTVSVPSKGYTRLRFRATNPGFWLMHCHLEWHAAVGMMLVLQVGEHSDFVKPPPNFPTCNKYMPDVDKSLFGL